MFFVKKEDGEIWPTNYFVKACYNDINNLWLLAGGDNSSKSSNSFLGHLESNETFGDAFKNSVDDNGGICRGVILSKIGGHEKTTLTFEGELTVGIYSGGVGIGQFIINWYQQNRSYCVDIGKLFENTFQFVQEELSVIIQDWDACNKDEAAEEINELKDMIISVNGYLKKRINDSSSEELSPDEGGYHSSPSQHAVTVEVELDNLIDAYRKTRIFRQINRKIRGRYTEANAETLRQVLDPREFTLDEMKQFRSQIGELVSSEDSLSLHDFLRRVREIFQPNVQIIGQLNQVVKEKDTIINEITESNVKKDIRIKQLEQALQEEKQKNKTRSGTKRPLSEIDSDIDQDDYSDLYDKKRRNVASSSHIKAELPLQAASLRQTDNESQQELPPSSVAPLPTQMFSPSLASKDSIATTLTPQDANKQECRVGLELSPSPD